MLAKGARLKSVRASQHALHNRMKAFMELKFVCLTLGTGTLVVFNASMGALRKF